MRVGGAARFRRNAIALVAVTALYVGFAAMVRNSYSS